MSHIGKPAGQKADMREDPGVSIQAIKDDATETKPNGWYKYNDVWQHIVEDGGKTYLNGKLYEG